MTGFDPFGGEKVNPSYEAVKLLPDQIGNAEIIKIEIPTEFTGCRSAVEEAIEKYCPDIVINVGQAGGRSTITPEKVAINLMDARIPDNAGEQPVDMPIHEDGENAYFASVPVKEMVAEIKENGIPASVSYTAGTYVCNTVMYHVQYLIHKKYPNIRAGFIHVPFCPEQVLDKPSGTPSMSKADIARGLECAIRACLV